MACEDCNRNCQLVHGKKKDLSPSVSRFFKILIGDAVSEVLCLPPKFAKTISHLAGKDFKLEDSTGAHWTVTMSYHKGFLSFHKGWTKFAADHKLQIGDFLVFNYLKNSLFVVQIFERTCSEKTEFSKIIRPMITEKIVFEETLPQRNATNDVSFRKVDSPVKKARHARNFVKPRTSSETDDVDNRATDTRETNREYSSSLGPEESNFKTRLNQPSSTLGPEGSNFKTRLNQPSSSLAPNESNFKSRLNHSSSTSAPEESNFITRTTQPIESNALLKPKSGIKEQPCMDDALCVMMDRGACYAETEKKAVLYDLSVFEMPKNEYFSGKRSINGEEDTHNHAQKLKASRAEANLFERNKTETGFILSLAASNVPNTGNCSKSPLSNEFASPRPRQVRPMDTHDEIKVIKKEQVILREEASYHVQKQQDLIQSLIIDEEGPSTSRFKRKAAKLEPDDSLDEPASNLDSITCLVVTEDRDFIELPGRLPLITFSKSGRGGGRGMDNRCTVELLDPKRRRWPGIYCEKFGSFFGLICGWKRFNESNNIRPGDRYVFSLERGSQCSYKVDVVRA